MNSAEWILKTSLWNMVSKVIIDSLLVSMVIQDTEFINIWIIFSSGLRKMSGDIRIAFEKQVLCTVYTYINKNTPVEKSWWMSIQNTPYLLQRFLPRWRRREHPIDCRAGLPSKGEVQLFRDSVKHELSNPSKSENRRCHSQHSRLVNLLIGTACSTSAFFLLSCFLNCKWDIKCDDAIYVLNKRIKTRAQESTKLSVSLFHRFLKWGE